MTRKNWTVYLSGEIHTNWRGQLVEDCADLPFEFLAPETDHASSDDCGDRILGPEPHSFWKDHKAVKINNLRTRISMSDADIVVVRFGDKYRQWNAAYEAGIATASGKPYIVWHPEDFDHALKEVDSAAMAVVRSHEQLVEIFKYVSGRSGSVS